MTWAWILIVIVILAVLLPFVIGMFLRDVYEGRLRVIFDRPPDEVWNELLNYQEHPLSGSMGRGVFAAEEVDGRPAWREDLGNTRLRVTTLELSDGLRDDAPGGAEEEGEGVHASTCPRRWVLLAEDEVVPMTARWTLEVAPAEPAESEGGTELRAHNVTTIRSGKWQSPVFRVVMRATNAAEKVLREYLRGIAGSLGVTARLVETQPDGEEKVSPGRPSASTRPG